MILKIDLDPAGNVTVEGNVNHSHGGKGGGTLKWKCHPQNNHQSWTVTFTQGSPFTDGKTHFEGTNGADGGTLKKNEDETNKHYPYDVTCTDSAGKQHESDPEVVLWPESELRHR